MSLDLTGLSNYTKENLKPLLKSAVFGGKTQDLIEKNGTVLTEVKSSVKIPIFDTDAAFQAQSCTWNPSGTTSITQREVVVGHIKIEEGICPKDLRTKFTQEAMKAGAPHDEFGNADFQEAYLNRKNERIANQLEVALWQGDTGSVNINLNKFNGLAVQIAAGSPISANTGDYTGTPAVTSSNVLAITRQIKNKIPAALKGSTDPVVIFVGYDWYDLYVDAGVSANLFHYDYNDKSKYGGLVIPGTNVKLEAVHGLDGTGDAYAMRLSNMALGTDLIDDETSYKMWYSQDNNDVRFRTEFSLGINVAFTNEVVRFLGTIS